MPRVVERARLNDRKTTRNEPCSQFRSRSDLTRTSVVGVPAFSSLGRSQFHNTPNVECFSPQVAELDDEPHVRHTRPPPEREHAGGVFGAWAAGMRAVRDSFKPAAVRAHLSGPASPFVVQLHVTAVHNGPAGPLPRSSRVFVPPSPVPRFSQGPPVEPAPPTRPCATPLTPRARASRFQADSPSAPRAAPPVMHEQVVKPVEETLVKPVDAHVVKPVVSGMGEVHETLLLPVHEHGIQPTAEGFQWVHETVTESTQLLGSSLASGAQTIGSEVQSGGAFLWELMHTGFTGARPRPGPAPGGAASAPLRAGAPTPEAARLTARPTAPQASAIR